MNDLIRAFQVHIAAPFPEDLAGEEIKGIDLVMLDSDSAAIIDKYISHKGYLRKEDIKNANECSGELGIVKDILKGSRKEYFEGIYNMLQEILESMEK